MEERIEPVELFRPIHAGDQQEVDAWIDRDLEQLRAYVRKVLGDQVREKLDSMDIVQDALVEFVEEALPACGSAPGACDRGHASREDERSALASEVLRTSAEA